MHMLIVGAIGLLINVAVVFILHSSAEHSLNVEGSLLARGGRLAGFYRRGNLGAAGVVPGLESGRPRLSAF